MIFIIQNITEGTSRVRELFLNYKRALNDPCQTPEKTPSQEEV